MASINPIASSPSRPEQRLSTSDDLFSAIQENNLSRVQELIEQGVDLKTRDKRGFGPLYWALINDNNQEITTFLLQKGVDPNENMNRSYAYTALHMIAEGKVHFHASLLNELCGREADLNARGSDQRTPLMLAAYCGNIEMVSFLADKGADLHLQDAHGNTALHWVAQSRKRRNFQKCIQVTKTLLEKGADPNAVRAPDKSTPLHSFFRCKEESHFLRNEKGVSFPRPNLNPSFVWNREEEDELVSLLLEGGANPNLQDSQGDTILHLAAQYGGPRSVFLLLKHGANPEIANARGEKAIDLILKMENTQRLTAIHFAAAMGHADIILLLLKHGANPNAVNQEGETPVHCAAKNGHIGALLALLGKKQPPAQEPAIAQNPEAQ